MTEKLDAFMKKHAPGVENSIHPPLRLEAKSKWIQGMAISAFMAATITLTLVNRSADELPVQDELAFKLEDELPKSFSEMETLLSQL